MLRLIKTRFYFVPIILRALDILELLSGSEIPLKTNDISSATNVPQTTAYRILRTLAYRGYVLQDVEGGFSMSNPLERDKTFCGNGHVARVEEPNLKKSQLSGDQVIEVMYSVLRSLRSGGSNPEKLGGRSDSA
jgi:DNA-binding transcriptional ArsR family regulator